MSWQFAGTVILVLAAMYFDIDPSVIPPRGDSPLTAPTETRQTGQAG